MSLQPGRGRCNTVSKLLIVDELLDVVPFFAVVVCGLLLDFFFFVVLLLGADNILRSLCIGTGDHHELLDQVVGV
jgi:hypothetical protein